MKWFLRFFLALYLFLFGGHYASFVKACHRCIHQSHKQVAVAKPEGNQSKLPALHFKASSSSKTKYDKLKATEEDEEDDEVSTSGKKNLDKTGDCFSAFLYSPLSYFFTVPKAAVNHGLHVHIAATQRFIMLCVIRI